MSDIENISELMADIGARARAAAARLASATAERKHAALISAADAVWKNRAEIIAEPLLPVVSMVAAPL